MEQYNEIVKVSGGMKVGAMSSGSEVAPHNRQSNGFTRVFLSIPISLEEQDREVCLEISSKDGKYYGLFAKELTKGIGKKGVLFESDHKEKIWEYFPDNLVVLASVKSSCSKQSKGHPYVLASWSANPDQKRFSVFLNSLVTKNSVQLRFRDKNMNVTFPCVHLGKKKSSGYNVRCDIDLTSKMEDIGEYKQLRILRSEPGQKYRPVTFKLFLKNTM